MPADVRPITQHAPPATQPELAEIVMGLHWDAPEDRATGEPVDLDALAVLLDAGHRVLEIIHPGRARNANGSVVHTGDSTTGTSAWDDERIFVFLDALPASVAAIRFVVISATGRPFSEARGATCHVSDHSTEHELVRCDLTALEGQAACCVASVSRAPSRWSVSTGRHAADEALCADLLTLVRRGKETKPRRRKPG